MPSLPDATTPYPPFPQPVPVPTEGAFDAPLVTVCINETWMCYLIGAAWSLIACSTWNSDDENTVKTVRRNAFDVLQAMAQLEPCPMPIEFRANPSYPQNFQYSLDGGTTWLDGPDTASHFTPVFTADGGAPGGYDLSVNGGHSDTAIPLLTANDPNAVVNNPATLLANLIEVPAGVDGIAIQALSTIGLTLLNHNGVALALNKIPAFGLATSALQTLAQGTDYTYDLLQIIP